MIYMVVELISLLEIRTQICHYRKCHRSVMYNSIVLRTASAKFPKRVLLLLHKLENGKYRTMVDVYDLVSNHSAIHVRSKQREVFKTSTGVMKKKKKWKHRQRIVSRLDQSMVIYKSYRPRHLQEL